MKAFYFVAFLLFFHSVNAQIWENHTPFDVYRFFQTSDSGFIASGFGRADIIEPVNIRKMDKNGKVEWEKHIFEESTVISAEVQDGYIGSSLKLTPTYRNPIISDSVFFKLNKKGDTLFTIRGKYYSRIKDIGQDKVLIYDDSLIKFNHVNKKFLWTKNLGEIHDVQLLNSKYNLLTTLDAALHFFEIDSTGKVLRDLVIHNSFIREGKFYKNGIITATIDNSNLIMTNLSFNSDTIWSKKILPPILDFKRFYFTTSKDFVYLAFTNLNQHSIFLKIDANGQIVWKEEKTRPSGFFISETYDGGIIASCTSGVFIDEIYHWNTLMKFDGKARIINALKEYQIGNNFFKVFWDIEQKRYVVKVKETDSSSSEMKIELVNINGVSFPMERQDKSSFIVPHSSPGFYLFKVYNGVNIVYIGRLTIIEF